MIDTKEKQKLHLRILKKYFITLGLVILNLLPFIISVSFFSGGAPLVMAWILILPVIILFNYLLTKGKISLCLYNLELFIFSTLGFLLNSLLYLKYIYYDSEGKSVGYFLLTVGALCIIISSVVAIRVRIYNLKKGIS